MQPVCSEIEFWPVKFKEGLIGFLSFVLFGELYISSVAVYAKKDQSGYRLVWPGKKVGERSIQLVHPISKRLEEEIEKNVFQKVNEVLNLDEYN